MSVASPGLPRAMSDMRLLRAGVLVALAMTLAGLSALPLIRQQGLDKIPFNVAFVLYLLNEPWVLMASAAGLVVLWLSLMRQRPEFNPAARLVADRFVPATAILVAAVTALGVHLVMHDFALSMDEYLALWQAEALTSGAVHGKVPDQWLPFLPALAPDYVRPVTESTWASQYLPVHSALLAIAMPLQAEWLVSPLLSGIAVVAAAGVAKRLLPQHPSAPAVAALLLATSSQFLATGMTYYAWQAHLAFNMVWLWLFLSPRHGVFVWAPILGILAMGLHRPQVHALFVLPFLVRLVFQRQWLRAGLAAGIYLLGIAFWLAWISEFQPNSLEAARGMGLPTLIPLVSRLMNLGQFVAWQNVAALILGSVAIMRWKILPASARDLAWGILATFCFYMFFGGTGGHGWGARYMHSVLGNFALLGTVGFYCLPEVVRGRGRLVVLACTVFAVILLPLRFVQTERIVRPFAAASRAVEAQDVDVVIIDGGSGWYLQDLVRNDPFLRNRPLIFRPHPVLATDLPAGIESVHVVNQEMLAGYGILPRESPPGSR